MKNKMRYKIKIKEFDSNNSYQIEFDAESREQAKNRAKTHLDILPGRGNVTLLEMPSEIIYAAKKPYKLGDL